MTERTWKIRDLKPDGSWGPDREVTIEQYRAEMKAAAERAVQVFKAAKEEA